MSSEDINIIEVDNHQKLTEFIDFPWQIYRDNPYWVPPLKSEFKKIITSKNPFFQHSKKKYFLAYKNGVLVGRIGGIVDRNFCEFQGEKTGFFSFYESIDDPEVSSALFTAVREDLSSQGMTKILGPTAPSTNDEIGWVLDSYNSMPYLMMPYNPPYYHKLAGAFGFHKAKDLHAFRMEVKGHDAARLKRVNEITMARHSQIRIRPLDFSDFEREVDIALKIYNSAWEKNWGFVPWTREEFRYIAKSLKSFLVPELALVAEKKHVPVGMFIAVPDYNILFKKANGSKLKFIWYYLTQRKKIKRARAMIMGVIKEYRKQGIEGLMFLHALNNSRKLGLEESEFSWVLEDNVLTNRACEMMGGKLYKKYRVYEMGI